MLTHSGHACIPNCILLSECGCCFKSASALTLTNALCIVCCVSEYLAMYCTLAPYFSADPPVNGDYSWHTLSSCVLINSVLNHLQCHLSSALGHRVGHGLGRIAHLFLSLLRPEITLLH